MKIFPPVLAEMGTLQVDESYTCNIELFQGWRVYPNSIFCKGHQRYGVELTLSDLGYSKCIAVRVISFTRTKKEEEKDIVVAADCSK